MERGVLHTLLLPNTRVPPDTPLLLRVALLYWKQALTYTKNKTPYAPNIPILGLKMPTGPVSTRRISAWTAARVDTVGMLFLDNTLMNYDTFVNERGVPRTMFILHANIVRYIKTTWAPNGTEPQTHALVHM